MQNSDSVGFTYTHDYEFVPFAPNRPFEIASGVIVPVGEYDYQNFFAYYSLGTQHFLSGSMSYQQGTLYGGTKRTARLGGGRIEFSPQFSVEPSIEINRVVLPWGVSPRHS